MSGIKPPKLLQVSVDTVSDYAVWTEGDPSDWWFGYAYRWTITATVTPSTHSSDNSINPSYYTAQDINVGDWISTTTNGVAVQITEIIEQGFDNLTAIVEDVDRFNTFSDNTQNGLGGPSAGNGYLFEVSDDGLPILMGVAAGLMPPTFQTDLISRFSYRNIFNKYIRVNQPDHTFTIGDIVRIDNDGIFEAAAADIRANAAIGIVNSIGIPSIDWFTFRPLCQVLNDVMPPLVGTYGQLYFLDPANPGKLTDVLPASNARPIYMRLDTPNRALLLDAGMFDYVDNNEGETNKYDVESVTAGQVTFTMPADCVEVLYMSINGIENENFTFNVSTKVLNFDPIETGYGIDVDDEVFFIYKS